MLDEEEIYVGVRDRCCDEEEIGGGNVEESVVVR